MSVARFRTVGRHRVFSLAHCPHYIFGLVAGASRVLSRSSSYRSYRLRLMQTPIEIGVDGFAT